MNVEKASQLLKELAGKSYGIEEEINAVDSTKFHVLKMDEIKMFEWDSENIDKSMSPIQDGDIGVAKGQNGNGLNEQGLPQSTYKSIYNKYLQRTKTYGALAEQDDYNEGQLNILPYAQKYIADGIAKGYVSRQELADMVSTKLAAEQNASYIEANGRYEVPLNAVALLTLYGSNLGKISNQINARINEGKERMSFMDAKVRVEDKSDRWIYDKMKHVMPEAWVNELSSLFSYKQLLTEQYTSKANSMTVGTTQYGKSILVAALYCVITTREIKDENKEIRQQLRELNNQFIQENGRKPEAEEFDKLKSQLNDVVYSGIASITSIFSVGYSDFIYRCRLEDMFAEGPSSDIGNLAVVAIPYGPYNPADIKANFESQNLFDKEIRFTRQGNNVQLADGLVVEMENSMGTNAVVAPVQKLGVKELEDMPEGEHKDFLLNFYARKEFSKSGAFAMYNNEYTATVVHIRYYASVMKIWLRNVKGVDTVFSAPASISDADSLFEEPDMFDTTDSITLEDLLINENTMSTSGWEAYVPELNEEVYVPSYNFEPEEPQYSFYGEDYEIPEYDQYGNLI